MTCPHGKEALTAKIAKAIATRMRVSRPESTVHAYRCRECGEWHVGSKNPAKRVDKKVKKYDKRGK